MTPPILIENLRKRYRRPDPDRAYTLQSFVARGLRRTSPGEWFWALDGLSLEVGRGQMVGVIGRNGAGKSTLLRLVGGVGRPDAGRIITRGRIGALIDLGAGFHPDLNGRENIYLNGVIAGLTRREVAQRFDQIVEFAELPAFIDSPLRTYSTGMQMRLAFSVAVHTDPEILLIDEVLAVGDLAFQKKCLERINRFREAGCAILLVSHDTTMVRRTCDQAVWLERGQAQAVGPAGKVVEEYLADLRNLPPAPVAALASPAQQAHLRLGENRFGSQEITITAVHLLDAHGAPLTRLRSGDPLLVEIDYQAAQPVADPIFGISISQGEDSLLYDTSTASAGLAFSALHGQGKVRLFIERLDAGPGVLTLDAGIYRPDWSSAYDYHWQAYRLVVDAPPGEKGIMRPPARWEWVSGEEQEPGGASGSQ